MANYGDTIQDWVDNPVAAWQAVWARVNVAADRLQVRRGKIPQLEHDLGAALARVQNMPASTARTRQLAQVKSAQAELASLKAQASGLVAKTLDAIAQLRTMQARLTAGGLSGYQTLGAFGQFQILAPAVLVALVAAAAAAIVWSTKFDSRLGLFNAAIKAGLTPADAAKFAGPPGAPTNPLGISFDLTTVALVLGGALLLPQILKGFGRGRAQA